MMKIHSYRTFLKKVWSDLLPAGKFVDVSYSAKKKICFFIIDLLIRGWGKVGGDMPTSVLDENDLHRLV